MYYKILPPKNINAKVKLPSSKSISNRALIINAILGTTKMPHNLSLCDDTDVIIRALKDKPYEINIKASGTAMRFMTALLSITVGEHHILTGTERMKQRPIKILVDALKTLGADIEYKEKEGYPPLLIRGKKLEGGKIEIEGDISSQYISALMLVAPALKNGLEIKLIGEIVSRPYIDLTLHIMHSFGAEVEWTDVDTIVVYPKEYVPKDYVIENDWTSAAYWYEILSLIDDKDSKIEFSMLKNSSRQGDSAVKYIFSLLGIKSNFSVKDKNGMSNLLLSCRNRTIPRLEYDFTNQPDLAQTMIAICPILNIPFKFIGVENLKLKETDRITAMITEMAKLGYVIDYNKNSEIIWEGKRCKANIPIIIDTYNDHRMAMTFAPLCLKLGSIIINNPNVVTKSYPEFWNELTKAGFKIIECD